MGQGSNTQCPLFVVVVRPCWGGGRERACSHKTRFKTGKGKKEEKNPKRSSGSPSKRAKQSKMPRRPSMCTESAQ